MFFTAGQEFVAISIIFRCFLGQPQPISLIKQCCFRRQITKTTEYGIRFTDFTQKLLIFETTSQTCLENLIPG